MFVLPYVVYHTWISIHFFWCDVLFCNRLHGKSECFVISTNTSLDGGRQFEVQSIWTQSLLDWITVPCCIWMRLDELCSLVRDSGSSYLSAHQLLFLAGEFIWSHNIHTIYWCPFLLDRIYHTKITDAPLVFDEALSFLKGIDASCGVWWVWSSVGWMRGWVCPCVWGCLAGVLPAWPQCHLF